LTPTFRQRRQFESTGRAFVKTLTEVLFVDVCLFCLQAGSH